MLDGSCMGQPSMSEWCARQHKWLCIAGNSGIFWRHFAVFQCEKAVDGGTRPIARRRNSTSYLILLGGISARTKGRRFLRDSVRMLQLLDMLSPSWKITDAVVWFKSPRRRSRRSSTKEETSQHEEARPRRHPKKKIQESG